MKRPIASIRRENRSARCGYTLAEVMITLLIAGFVMAGLAQFMFSTSRLLYDSSIRADLDADMRRLTQRIMEDAQTSDAFYLYKSFQSSDRNSVDGTDRLGADTSGDFLLFVYTEPQPNTNSTVYITKLVGYFRKPETAGDATTRGPIYRFEMNYADQTIPAATSVLETLLSGKGYDDDDYTKVIPFAKGRYSNRLFYNQGGECVMVGGEFYRGNTARSSTEIYRLTINP
jgi:prepilin-type N-terminal cleavage/methylation domain-containing protein